jgi:hypothetical protein
MPWRLKLCVNFEMLLFSEVLKGRKTRRDRNRFLEKKLEFRMCQYSPKRNYVGLAKCERWFSLVY